MDAVKAGPIQIIGGGIGGLTVGIALLRRGFDIQIYEQAPSYAHVGGGHWLYANALHTLQRIDPEIARDMRALGKGFDGFHFATPDLRTLFFESTSHYTPSPELAPIVIHRANIIDQLARRIPPRRLHFSKRLERCTPDRLFFEDGTEVEANLIIGADGIHSRARRDLLTRVPARFSGQVGLWGISDHQLPADTGHYFTELWSSGLRMGFTYVGNEGVYWFMVVRGDDIPTDPQLRKRFILERATPFPAELVEAVQKTPADVIHTNPLYDMAPPRRWYTDTACFLGDAVHACTPNLGQGGCQAIEDALCLAEMLSAHDAPRDAFAAYQRARFIKATSVVYLSRWLGNMAQLHGALARLRNLVVWLGPSWMPRPVLQWIMSVRDDYGGPRKPDTSLR